MLLVQRLLVGGGVSILSQGYLGNMEIAHSSGAVNTAIGAGHALDIAAVDAAILSLLHGLEAVIQAAGVHSLPHFTA